MEQIGRPPEFRNKVLYVRVSEEAKGYISRLSNGQDMSKIINNLILWFKNKGPGEDIIMAKSKKKVAKKATKKSKTCK